jgi:hypothetical protein
MDLERRGIFGTDIRISGRYGAQVDLGILSRQALEEQRATDKIRTRLGPDLFVQWSLGCEMLCVANIESGCQ